MKKLQGVVVPIVTPLTEEDTIDEASLRKLVDYCIDSGLQAIYPCGTTGEMMFLSTAERKTIAEIVVNQVNHRVPVFIHVGAWNQKETIELAKHAYEIGADGIAIVTPAFFSISDEGLIEYFTSVARSVPEDYPVYLYAIPQCAVNDISCYVAEKCADLCKNIVGIKYSYSDMTRIQQLIRIHDGEFSVMAGPDHLFAATVAMGGDGTVSGNAQILPEYYGKIWRALQDNDYKKAGELQQKTNRLNEILCKENNISAYKSILKAKGIIKTKKTRKPFEELTQEQEDELFRMMNEEMANS